ncbi:WD40 domain-containing protein [Encephalitozoon intestinalis ATCC 50506]|uniref:WD40 domain-containing protein n=1 Tax=Encephalitozoon intestinalis (strain ATCC 50506) TaxID=876142 RepID=E0S6C0_ENCIT|nr:WD40 domain-containing protein [Encephalitozoon intestinalis ATCC 50506]ADM11255.1 WD40 domain-containing protein [Encephalitozoon intestinalis ATCC 50506]UTX44923.1 WD40 domain-containing protein [Encephalitozoon intestinalis]
MISSIGFLPGGVSIERLKEFVYDEDIHRALDYLGIPVVDKSKMACDDDIDESEEIVENDIIVFCTPNEDDVSFLQFYVQNRECTNIFLHHDTYVFSTICDSTQAVIGGETYVALATFEKDIMVFDPFVRNPVLPQVLLKGHEEAVLSIECSNGVLFSGGLDSTIIEWDTEKALPKNRIQAMGPVNKLGTLNSSVIYSVENSLYWTDREIRFDGEVERIRIMDNKMLVSDSTGILRHYDLRNVSDPVMEKRIHEDSITGIDVLGSNVYTGSLDGSIKIVSLETFDVMNSEDVEEKIFSLKVHEDGFYVYGGEKNEPELRYIDCSKDE